MPSRIATIASSRKRTIIRLGFPSNRGDSVIRILFLLPVLP